MGKLSKDSLMTAISEVVNPHETVENCLHVIVDAAPQWQAEQNRIGYHHGCEKAVAEFSESVREILDGEDGSVFEVPEPWGPVRKRLVSLVGQAEQEAVYVQVLTVSGVGEMLLDIETESGKSLDLPSTKDGSWRSIGPLYRHPHPNTLTVDGAIQILEDHDMLEEAEKLRRISAGPEQDTSTLRKYNHRRPVCKSVSDTARQRQQDRE